MPPTHYNYARLLGSLASAVFLLASASFAHATNLRFAWNASADPNIAGYNLSYGTSSGRYTQSLNAGSSASATVSGLSQGATYFFVVTAYNSIGLQSLPSNEVSLTVSNLPPSVSLTSPQAGASLSGDSAIGLTASATDSDGNVTKVEFYQDANKIGESTTAPYSATWNNAPSGSFVLTALAYDDGGAAVRSSGVSVTVTGTIPAPTGTPNPGDRVHVVAMTPIVKAGGVARFKVVATQASAAETVVNYAMAGTAADGVNYSTGGTTGQATIAPGRRSVLMPMQTLAAPGVKSGKTIVMTVLPGPGYVPVPGRAVIRIVPR